MSNKRKNPYIKLKGFGLRVYHADRALRKYSESYEYVLHTRGFDNNFEAGDGDAVVWELMDRVSRELAKHPDRQSRLLYGIQRMFLGSINKRGFPTSWEVVYRLTLPKCNSFGSAIAC